MGTTSSSRKTHNPEMVTLSAQLSKQRYQLYELQQELQCLPDMKQELQSLRDIKHELETRCRNLQAEKSKLHGQILKLDEQLKQYKHTRAAQNNEIKHLRRVTQQKQTVWNRLANPKVRTEIITEMLQDESINSNLMDDNFERKYIENVLVFVYHSMDLALRVEDDIKE